MGDDNKEQVGKMTPRRSSIYDFVQNQRDRLFGSNTGLENEFTPISQGMYNTYRTTADRTPEDYGDIMSQYKDFRSGGGGATNVNLHTPHNFSFERITPTRSTETQSALTGFGEFADTGGYSPTDIQELRARGVSPIRSAYGNTMMQMDRARALGPEGGSPNYIAAVSRAQRELPQQLSDATTNVNAGLAENIRSGRLEGLRGVAGISEAEAGRGHQAALANQAADLRTQELTEQGLSANEARQIAIKELGLRERGLDLSAIEGQRGLFGTAPGMLGTIGNQMLGAYGQRAGLEQIRNQFGLGLIGAQLGSLGNQAQSGNEWWRTALNFGSRMIPFMGFGGGDDDNGLPGYTNNALWPVGADPNKD